MILNFKKHILFFLLIFSSVAFSQNDLIDYCINFTINIQPFKDLKISKITTTWYELDKNSTEKFHRTDKVLYTYDSLNHVLYSTFLSYKDKPYKGTVPNCYKEDSLGVLHQLDENGVSYDSINDFEFDEHRRIKRGNGENYFYDEKGKLIKTIAITPGQNCPLSFLNTTEYAYSNDTLISDLSYRDYGEGYKQAGKLREYIYDKGKLIGYKSSEKYFTKPKTPLVSLFEVIENGKAVKESVYENDKLIRYYITKFGE